MRTIYILIIFFTQSVFPKDSSTNVEQDKKIEKSTSNVSDLLGLAPRFCKEYSLEKELRFNSVHSSLNKKRERLKEKEKRIVFEVLQLMSLKKIWGGAGSDLKIKLFDLNMCYGPAISKFPIFNLSHNKESTANQEELEKYARSLCKVISVDNNPKKLVEYLTNDVLAESMSILKELFKNKEDAIKETVCSLYEDNPISINVINKFNHVVYENKLFIKGELVTWLNDLIFNTDSAFYFNTNTLDQKYFMDKSLSDLKDLLISLSKEDLFNESLIIKASELTAEILPKIDALIKKHPNCASGYNESRCESKIGKMKEKIVDLFLKHKSTVYQIQSESLNNYSEYRSLLHLRINSKSQLGQDKLIIKDTLSRDEIEAIKNYTKDSYPEINSCLRKNNCSDEILNQINLIKNALLKIKSKESVSEKILFRGTSLSDDLISKLDESPSFFILDKAFLSTSSNVQIAKSFNGNIFTEESENNNLLVIKSKNCVGVSVLSTNSYEEEYLCPPGTSFKVEKGQVKGLYFLTEN